MEEGEAVPTHFQLKMPDDTEAGAYANVLGVWHTAHEFTLDFSATQPAEQGQLPDGSVVMVVPARVTARVKIPPTLVFQVLRAISESMTKYEQTFGPIRRPGPDEPLFPPDTYPEDDGEPGGTDG